MRSLIDILDLTSDEITGLLDTADDIIARPTLMPICAIEKSWQRSSLSPQPAPVSALKQLCTSWAARC